MKCIWCMDPKHTIQSCPSVAQMRVATEHGIVDPMTVEDVNDRLAMRTIGYRTFAGQLVRLCKERGVEIPADIEALNPDAQYEAA